MRLLDATYTDQSVTMLGSGPGSPEILIVGNTASPRSVVWSGGPMGARDGAIFAVYGIDFHKPTGCTQFLLANQNGVIDIDAATVILGACPGGTRVEGEIF